tara:strand:+ start:2342 stop:3508 length:1167 start_codon:yes stop_codon:yes gene_type:complete
MEIISGLITLAAIYYGVSFVLGLAGAGVNAVTGGSVSGVNFTSSTSFVNGKLSIKYKGNPKASGPVAHYISMKDKETDFPIYSPIFNNGEDNAFAIVQNHGENDFDGLYWPDWVEVLTEPLPLDERIIRCPRQGSREIVVTVMITTQGDYRIWSEHSTTFTYQQKERGLLDRVEDMPKIRKQMICFGMAMAFSDGSSDKKEAKVIQDWALSKVETETDLDKKNELKETLNNEIKQAFKLGKEGKLDLKILVKSFNSMADTGDKWELMELLRDIMAADGEADKNELEILRNMQVELGIDPEEFNNMLSEAMTKISSVGTAVETEGDKCSVMGNLIGIDQSWTIEQKKAHLVKEANRANGMANVAANDTERENANKMLENIAYYRKNCLN